MRKGIVFVVSVLIGHGSLFAAGGVPDWDEIVHVDSFVEFVTKNKASVVSLTNINLLNESEIRGLMIDDAPLADWSTLGQKLTNVVCLRITPSAADLPVAFFSAITNYPRLEYLYLKCSKTLAIPAHINLLTNLVHLRYLGIAAPLTTNIDSGIYRVGTLRELFLRVGAVNLPDGVASLSELESLVIHGKPTKPIRSFPADLPKSRIHRLEVGNVPGLGKMLPLLPPGLFDLRMLRCQLSTIPDAWLKQPKLEVIDLNDNKLTQFPTELLALPSLKLIGLDLNCITNIPPIKVIDDRSLKISLIGNPIQHFAPENEPLVERGVIEKSPAPITVPSL